MDNNDLLKRIMELDTEMLQDLNDELDKELSKPYDKWDEQKIIELTRAITEIKGITLTEESMKIGEKAILAKLDNKAPKRRKVIKTLSTVAACLVAVVVLNQGIAYAFDVKMFPKLYEVVDGAIVIHMDQDRKETQQILNDIKEKCNEYGINTLIPTYLPEGYAIEILEYRDNNLTVHLKKDNTKINIYYKFNINSGTLGIPSDEGNFTETIINGHEFLISTEDNQYRAVSIEKNFIFLFTSHNLDYSEAEKMVNSLS